jgi:hypothetical protein
MVSCLEVSVYKALIRRLCKIERRLNVLKSCYSIWKGGVFQAILVLLLLTGNQGTQMLPSKIYRCFSAPDGSENKVFQMFWDHVLERGLMSRITMTE